MVIGCGDAGRLGTVHEASYEVLHTRGPATHSCAQARRPRGVLPGMSLPVTVGTEAVGTVCLTGDPAEVRRFGLVVQRRAEILLEEAAPLRSWLLHERAVDDCVRDLAPYDPEAVDAETVEARVAELGARSLPAADRRAAARPGGCDGAGVTDDAASDGTGGVRRRAGRGRGYATAPAGRAGASRRGPKSAAPRAGTPPDPVARTPGSAAERPRRRPPGAADARRPRTSRRPSATPAHPDAASARTPTPEPLRRATDTRCSPKPPTAPRLRPPHRPLHTAPDQCALIDHRSI
ncbi:sugar diacid recognition domain-containing protein [Streptomyces sp. NPDC096311]|uniref:sugar diacid recognition domain-containing protein n=1 Tax=Streptomyces sp. NPDC096311 TaxID=3366083 RepID=UPI00380EA2E4